MNDKLRNLLVEDDGFWNLLEEWTQGEEYFVALLVEEQENGNELGGVVTVGERELYNGENVRVVFGKKLYLGKW